MLIRNFWFLGKEKGTPELLSFGEELLFCSEALIGEGLDWSKKYLFESVPGNFGLVNFAEILVFDVDVELVVDIRYLD